MIDDFRDKQREADAALGTALGLKAARKIRARADDGHGVWLGLGMMGLIGWSVAVPTLLGAGLGIWLDGHYPGRHPWTLALLMAGLCLGCFNAWRWVDRQDKAMVEQKDGSDKADGPE
jgi:ATP synthase protein I